MHLRDAALVDQGDACYTGQPIGFVGNTGRRRRLPPALRGLDGPGWYSGGHAVDPLPLLTAWDKTS